MILKIRFLSVTSIFLHTNITIYISLKGKKATLKSLEEDIKELREQIEALPKNVVNLHMHGTGSELQNENVEEAIEITNSTLGDKKSKDDEIRSDANIHVHMQLVEYSEKCAKDDEGFYPCFRD